MVDLAADGGEPSRAGGGASVPAWRRGQLGPAVVRSGGHGRDAAGVHGAERVVVVGGPVDGVRAGCLEQHQRESVFPLDIGFAARVLALCALPRRDPGDLRRYKRVNGPYRLVVVAMGDQGLPWGSIPRLALAWLCTNVVRKRSRVVELGSSFERFFTALGYPLRMGGRNHRNVKTHVERLFSAAFYMDVEKWAGADRWERNVEIWPVSKRVRLWTSRRGRTAGGWTVASVELSEPLYEAIIERPFPINLNAIKALRKSPLAIDLYLWLTFRMKGSSASSAPELGAAVQAVLGDRGACRSGGARLRQADAEAADSRRGRVAGGPDQVSARRSVADAVGASGRPTTCQESGWGAVSFPQKACGKRKF